MTTKKPAKKMLRKQKLWAVVSFIEYECPDTITLYASKAAADKACPNCDCYSVIGPLTIGKEEPLYGS